MRLTETVRSGRVVADRYELLSPIGSGAMGVVWRANDPYLNRIVAIKLLRLPLATTPDEARRARQRVFREARIAARLPHPHAVAIYDIVTDDDGQPALVMEYVPSQDLASLIVEHGTLSPGAAARVGAETASALAAAHAAGIVHRDVKPGNVLLVRAGGTTTGAAKITDFGLARATGDVTVTETGLLLGTPPSSPRKPHEANHPPRHRTCSASAPPSTRPWKAHHHSAPPTTPSRNCTSPPPAEYDHHGTRDPSPHSYWKCSATTPHPDRR